MPEYQPRTSKRIQRTTKCTNCIAKVYILEEKNNSSGYYLKWNRYACGMKFSGTAKKTSHSNAEQKRGPENNRLLYSDYSKVTI